MSATITDTESKNETQLNFANIIVLVLLHASAVFAFFFIPNWIDISLFFGFYLVTGFGITIGFHRLLTHRSFECSRFIRGLFAFCGTAALQGGPSEWVGTHRKHHQYSDREGDPHSPREGFLHSHFLWIFEKKDSAHLKMLANDLTQDSFIRWLDRDMTVIIPWLITAGICFLIGGWSGVVWGAILRTIFVWHATWCVNSVCHIFGARPHKTRDNSRNSWWVGLWALGEGWHNNHHANPKAAVHDYHWWEIDTSGYILRILEKFHIIRNLVRSRSKGKIEKTI